MATARAPVCTTCEIHAEAVFRVEGMDCNEEVVILERRLRPLAGMPGRRGARCFRKPPDPEGRPDVGRHHAQVRSHACHRAFPIIPKSPARSCAQLNGPRISFDRWAFEYAGCVITSSRRRSTADRQSHWPDSKSRTKNSRARSIPTFVPASSRGYGPSATDTSRSIFRVIAWAASMKASASILPDCSESQLPLQPSHSRADIN